MLELEFYCLEWCGKVAQNKSHYYDYDEEKCYIREGLRDITKNKSCNMRESGRLGYLLGKTTTEKLDNIVENLKMDKREQNPDVKSHFCQKICNILLFYLVKIVSANYRKI